MDSLRHASSSALASPWHSLFLGLEIFCASQDRPDSLINLRAAVYSGFRLWSRFKPCSNPSNSATVAFDFSTLWPKPLSARPSSSSIRYAHPMRSHSLVGPLLPLNLRIILG